MPSIDTGKNLPLPVSAVFAGGRAYRRWIILVVVLVVVGIYGRSKYHEYKPEFIGGHLTSDPPTYKKLREYERNLPQHNFSLPFPEGRQGRYVRFSNQIRGLGWNNILNEM
jgi:hypothetical protein